MGRFNSFNSLMGSSSNQFIEDDRDNEENEAPVISTEYEEKKVYDNCEVELPEQEELSNSNFTTNVFWNVNPEVNDDELEDMLADYE